jgi:hypothetical protein
LLSQGKDCGMTVEARKGGDTETIDPEINSG